MNSDLNNTYNKERFSSLFADNIGLINHRGNGILNGPREDALGKFNQLGIPNKKNENYKYTDVSNSFSYNFKYLFDPEKIQFNVEDIFKCDIPDLDTEVAILVNGFYYNRKQPFINLPEGAIIGSLSKAAEEYPQLVEKHYRKYAKENNEGLVALNSAFSLDGIFLYIPKNVVLERPIQIVNILLSENDLLVQHRNLFVFEENSSANVIICDHSLSPKRFLTNQVLEVFIGENAHFDLTRVQNEHLETTQVTHSYIQQERNSNSTFNTITLHGGVVRNNINISLNGEGCESNTFGLYIEDRGQHVDNFTVIEHNKPNCESNQLFKGILDDSSSGAFNGKIFVEKDAQNTLAYQSNNNILLTDTAKMYSKPQLEIYADDVKCSHGATVGQLDDDAMFYIRARGINENEAKLMLMNGFTNDIIKQIKVKALRDRIDELVSKRLRGELSRCNNCDMHCGT